MIKRETAKQIVQLYDDIESCKAALAAVRAEIPESKKYASKDLVVRVDVWTGNGERINTGLHPDIAKAALKEQLNELEEWKMQLSERTAIEAQV